MDIKKQVRVRFAPSPTGHLHIGGLRTALFNWLFARHHGGAFLLRIEDTDIERSTVEYRDSILHSFAWTHLEYDEEIVTQSERIEEHRKVAQQLIAAGKAYKCFCSPEDLVVRYTQEHKNDEAFVKYDGYCRDRVMHVDNASKQYVIRFKLPDNCTHVQFNDLIKGPVTFGIDQLDDFIIIRSGGYPMYNFVVVVDDAFMKITHIIRGEEHLINTPKQILLYEACGHEIPQFAHLPLILGPSGDKLSKRDGATSVIEYRKEGYIPQALLNYLARLGWSHGDQEIFSLSELIQFFSLEHIGTKGAIFDFEKLAWVNSVYIRQATAEALCDSMVENIDSQFLTKLLPWKIDTVKRVITLYQERVKTIKFLAEEVVLVHSGPVISAISQEEMLKWVTQDTKAHIDQLIKVCESVQAFEHDALASAIKTLAQSLNIKLVTLLQPVRLALIGKTAGPGVFDLLEIIGKGESIARLCALRDTL
jgi:glutamyl-tRNA synthetase